MVVVYRVHGGAAFVDGGERRVFYYNAITIHIYNRAEKGSYFCTEKEKTKMIYYGFGNKNAWVDFVQLKGERKSRTFHGFTLYRNQIFGKDLKGAFVLTNVVEDSSGKSGIYATILLWRLDKKRGWVQQWERSDTTVNALDLYYKRCTMRERYARITRESRESHVNPLQEVKGQKYFQLLT